MQNEWEVWLEYDTKYHNSATNTGSSHNHPLFNNSIVRIDILTFAKPLKVILT